VSVVGPTSRHCGQEPTRLRLKRAATRHSAAVAHVTMHGDAVLSLALSGRRKRAHLPRVENRRGPEEAIGTLSATTEALLFEGGLNRGQRGFDSATGTCHHADNGDRDTGCDEPVFDGGRTTFILCKPRQKHPHIRAPLIVGDGEQSTTARTIVWLQNSIKLNPIRPEI
jgi:hypothetical protein